MPRASKEMGTSVQYSQFVQQPGWGWKWILLPQSPQIRFQAGQHLDFSLVKPKVEKPVGPNWTSDRQNCEMRNLSYFKLLKLWQCVMKATEKLCSIKHSILAVYSWRDMLLGQKKKCTVNFILSSPIFSYCIGIISWKLLTDVSVIVLAKTVSHWDNLRRV